MLSNSYIFRGINWIVIRIEVSQLLWLTLLLQVNQL